MTEANPRGPNHPMNATLNRSNPLPRSARATGTLAGRARTTDIVDASVVEGALRRGDLIVSSDEGDLAAIAAAASRHIDIDHP